MWTFLAHAMPAATPRSRENLRMLALLFVTVLVGALAGRAEALDPERSIGQYRHTAWRLSQGDAPSNIRAIVQTADGFLWLGGDNGLFRFDGVTFEPVALANPDRAHTAGVNALLVAPDGALIIGFAGGGIARFKDGKFVHLRHHSVSRAVLDAAQGRNGAVWVGVGAMEVRLARYQNGAWDIVDRTWNGPDGFVTSLLVDRRNDLWVAVDHQLFRLKNGSRRFDRVPLALGVGPGLAEGADGSIWISDTLGVRRLDAETLKIDPSSVGQVGRTTRQTSLEFDRQGNLWGAAFGGGLFRVRAPLTPVSERRADSRQHEEYKAADGLTGDIAFEVFEDREGNIWVGTNGGLDRFSPASINLQEITLRDPAFEYTLHRGLDGAVYVFDSQAVFRALPGERLKPFLDDVDLGRPDYLCEGPAGVLWVGARHRLRRIEKGRHTTVPLPAGVGFDALCHVDRQGVVWIGALDDGILSYDGKAWKRFNPVPGVWYNDGALTPDGAVLFTGGRNFVYRAEGDRVTALPIPAKLKAGSVGVVSGDQAGMLLGTNFGIVRWDGPNSRLLDVDRYPWLSEVAGIESTTSGDTWILSSMGLVRVSTAQLRSAFADPNRRLDARIFTQADGLIGMPDTKGGEKIVSGGDGRLWFGTPAAVGLLDPQRLPRNTLPPPVVIRSITVDGHRTDAPKDIVLPKGARSLQVDFTALSLTLPERIRFRYRLDGVDENWVDAGDRRQAFYTNLKPGRYLFRVKAANNDGVWNEEGARLSLRLPPTFLQSHLFLGLCVLAGLGLVWLAYTLRLRQVSERLRLALQERLAERERIARELHDTLLQGVQGLVLKFQSASDDVPQGTPAREQLERALERAEDVVVEARERVRSLRAGSTLDLAATLADVADRIDPDHRIDTQIVSEGLVRPLHAVVADEVERIVTEALFNAYSHSQARQVIVEIAYDAKQLGVRIKDDGVGIAQSVLDAGGREGHYGLTGMRERAAKIDGQLVVRSRPGAGAEIELTVPAQSAFRAPARRWPITRKRTPVEAAP